MYCQRHFEETRLDVLHALLREHPLGLLIATDAAGRAACHPLPFLLDDGPSPAGTLVAHVPRANPVWQEADGREVLVVFQGPQAYVSPGWYASKAEHGKVVPTWNFVFAEARGTLRAIDDAQAVRRVVERLTERHEAGQAHPWRVSDAPADFIEATLKAIVAIEIPLASLAGKWKLNQNRTAADRAGVAQALREQGHPMADWMGA